MTQNSESFNPHTQPLEGAHSIEASAGTGKTYSITLLWLRLIIEKDLNVDQILVSTFTKAATAELKERLLNALQNALSEARRLQNGAACGDSPEALILQNSRWADTADWGSIALRLSDALSSFDLAPISTIHSFCQSLIARHSVELGCDSGLTLVQDHAEFLEPILDDNIMRFTEHGAPDVKVLKKIGSRVALHPNASLLVANPVPSGHDEQLAQRILTEAPKALACLTNSRTRGATENIIEAFRATRQQAPLSEAAEKNLPSEFLGLWKEYGELRAQTKRHAAGVLAHQVKREFPEAKARASVQGFDDLVLTVHRALKEQGADGPLASAVRSRLRAAVIDECQDSDALQIEVFEQIFGHNSTISFIVIGDPKQSIYRFRGADLASYKRLAGDAKPAGKMLCNHRSDRPLIEAINQLYGHAYKFPDALNQQAQTLYTEVSAAHESRIEDPEKLAPLIIHWSDQKKRGAAQQELAEMVARESARLVDSGTRIVDRHLGGLRPIHFGDIAVLAYGHRELGIIRRVLTQAGIPCQSSGNSLGSVFNSTEARDVHVWLQLLAAIDEHGDVLGKLLAFYGTPLGAGAAQELLLLRTDAGQQAAMCMEFRREASQFRKTGPLPLLLKRAQTDKVIASNLEFADGERRYTNWRHIGSLLQQEHARGKRSPHELSQWLGRLIAAKALNSGNEPTDGESALMKLETDSAAVQLVSVHGAKGLEYPVVFCPFLWSLQSKLQRRKDQSALFRTADNWCVDVGSPDFGSHLEKSINQESEEEHRKLYVALTRARHRLYLGLAPIEDSVSHENGAARSPLAALPGLGLRADDVGSWHATLKGIQYATLESASPGERPLDSHDHAVDSTDPSETQPLQPPPAPRPYNHLLKRTTSFTTLSKSDQDHDVAADRDAERTDSAPPTQSSTVDLLKPLGNPGAELGDKLHSVLEDYLGNRKPLKDAVAECKSPEIWEHSIGEILRAKLTFGDHPPVSLNELREGCITEMQFHLPVSALDPRTLSAVLLRDEEIQGNEDRSGWAADIGEHWTFGEFSGYLQGFIDLIFEHEDRWFVADYKSNILGGYDPDSLGRAMLEKNYLLQARLYALALHRHLQVQLRDYDYAKHFGGVAYLFVRGFPSDGVWFERPSLAALESLGNPFSIASK